jgi:hypothetical protein
MSNPEFTAPDYTTQDAATYKANIDASIAASADWVNLGCSYSAGTFTIHGAEGTALSATNPAFVKFQDKGTPGYVKFISVEANQAFIDDAGASEIINNLFGATTGVAWGNDCPFYIYAVANDAMDTVQFMLSRIPHRKTAPAVGEIGAPDDAVADNQYSFWSFDNIDETLYDGNPCVCVGSIRMQMSASDDWTVQALATTDGIGQFNEQTIFVFPEGQNGAASGTYVLSNAGTEPEWATQQYEYQMGLDGIVHVVMDFLNVNVAGVGSQETHFVVPLAARITNRTCFGGSAHYLASAGRFTMSPVSSNGTDFDLWDTHGTIGADGAGNNLNNQDYDTNDDLAITLIYPVKDS